MAKRILLSVPEPILHKLEAEKQKYSYTSIQEVILEMLRDKLFIEAEHVRETRGRPKKIREEKILTRKKIFSKKGGQFLYRHSQIVCCLIRDIF